MTGSRLARSRDDQGSPRFPFPSSFLQLTRFRGSQEGAEYSVEIKFRVNNLVSGLKYIQAAKRAGMTGAFRVLPVQRSPCGARDTDPGSCRIRTVDKLESMIGSYGPSPEPVTKRFVTEEAPSGMLARSGSYTVRSRVIDDDKNVYVDFEWTFKLAKEW